MNRRQLLLGLGSSIVVPQLDVARKAWWFLGSRAVDVSCTITCSNEGPQFGKVQVFKAEDLELFIGGKRILEYERHNVEIRRGHVAVFPLSLVPVSVGFERRKAVRG
jgi:hypothetical protein